MSFLDPLLSVDGLMSVLTLTLMEIILGIDNIIFISILTERLRVEDQRKARVIGLTLALVMRIFLLVFISWIIGFKQTLFVLPIGDQGLDISIRDLILLFGGLFLIYKSTSEIHEKLEGDDIDGLFKKKKLSLAVAVVQIVLLDIVFSFDSILTAVGLVDNPDRNVIIMIVAVIISMVVMLWFAKSISDYINSHPTIKMLALSFLLMIGVLLVAEGFHKNIPKGYIYFAMSFSLLVEFLNLKARRRARMDRIQKRRERTKAENENHNNDNKNKSERHSHQH